MYLEKKEYLTDKSREVKGDERVRQQAFKEEKDKSHNRKSLSAGEWLRKVLGIDAPFGHDGLPTVWG
jgi:hypothetical protein